MGICFNDDTAYNKRYPIWKPSLEVIGALTLTWAIDRFALNADYARTGFSNLERIIWLKNGNGITTGSV
jgi:hypothetical protein